MRTLIQLIICLIIAWGMIALLWPQIADITKREPHLRG
jgi:hypothetical protein